MSNSPGCSASERIGSLVTHPGGRAGPQRAKAAGAACLPDLTRVPPPAGDERRHGETDTAATGEALPALGRKPPGQGRAYNPEWEMARIAGGWRIGS